MLLLGRGRSCQTCDPCTVIGLQAADPKVTTAHGPLPNEERGPTARFRAWSCDCEGACADHELRRPSEWLLRLRDPSEAAEIRRLADSGEYIGLDEAPEANEIVGGKSTINVVEEKKAVIHQTTSEIALPQTHSPELPTWQVMALQYNANLANATEAEELNKEPNIKDTQIKQSLKAEVPNNTIGTGQVIAQSAEQNDDTMVTDVAAFQCRERPAPRGRGCILH